MVTVTNFFIRIQKWCFQAWKLKLLHRFTTNTTFYRKTSNKTSTSAKNFCRLWSKELWSNWKSFCWEKNWLGTHSALLCPHRRHKNIQFFLKPRYDQFWGLSCTCWMLRQWPVGAKHSGIGKFIWVSSLRYLEFLFMKLTVCFPRIQCISFSAAVKK